MKRLTPIAIIAAAIVLVLAGQHFLRRSEPQGRSMGPTEMPVVAAVVNPRDFSDHTEAIGTVSANESITVTPSVSERVATVHFEDGASVEAGAVLVELEHDEETAALEEARVNLAEKAGRFDRVKALRDRGMVAEEELEAAETELEAARAQFLAAQARLDDRIITAPFAGVLGIRRVSPGALVSPGDLITTLDDLSLVKVDFTIPEALISSVAVGQSVEARSTAWPEDVFRGRVSSIDSRIDPTTRAVSVQAKIPNPGRKLRAGMLLTVELTSNRRMAAGVPERALLSYADRQYVFRVRGGRTAEQREIELGERQVGWVEVTRGVSPGDTIVVDGIMNLRDGAAVTIVSYAEDVDGATEYTDTEDGGRVADVPAGE